MKHSVSIVGGSGYTGSELLRILVRHPEVEVLHITSRELAGEPAAERLVNLPNVNLVYEMPDPDGYPDSTLVFVCVHHTQAMGMVPRLLEHSKVVDLSADYRLVDRKVYEEVYGVEHASPQISGVYGLPELHAEEIAGARLVANPGCYATGAILALAPLMTEDLIERERIVIDAKSGSSGAGMKADPFTHHPECAQAIRPYRVTNHRHVPEIDQELSLLAGESVSVNFTPHLVPIIRGILTTCHTFLKSPCSAKDIESLYEEFYKDSYFVNVKRLIPDLRGVVGSNSCDIGFEIASKGERLVIVSAIDNLTKGASGQAVQNMNLMLGMPEVEGLDLVGLYP